MISKLLLCLRIRELKTMAVFRKSHEGRRFKCLSFRHLQSLGYDDDADNVFLCNDTKGRMDHLGEFRMQC